MRDAILRCLAGMSGAAEESHISRDILLAELTGARVHIAHISTRGAVELIRKAKHSSIPVTCEVTPHHLALTDEAVMGFDTNTKMSPPLRSEEDRLALIEAVSDGTIDAIATDHAPHHMDEKMLEYDRALRCSWTRNGPGRRPQSPLSFRRDFTFARARTADNRTSACILVARRDARSRSDSRCDDYRSGAALEGRSISVPLKSHNTPFRDWRLRGAVIATFVAGREVFRLS